MSDFAELTARTARRDVAWIDALDPAHFLELFNENYTPEDVGVFAYSGSILVNKDVNANDAFIDNAGFVRMINDAFASADVRTARDGVLCFSALSKVHAARLGELVGLAGIFDVVPHVAMTTAVCIFKATKKVITAHARPEFVDVIPQLFELTGLGKRPWRSVVSLLALEGIYLIASKCDTASVEPGIVARMCAVFREHRQPQLLPYITEMLITFLKSHYDVICGMLNPDEFREYLSMEMQTCHKRHVVQLLEGTLRPAGQYRYGEDGIIAVKDMLREALLGNPDEYIALLRVYATVSEYLDVYEEEPDELLLVLIGCATDPLLGPYVMRLMAFYVVHEKDYPRTCRRLADSELLKRMANGGCVLCPDVKERIPLLVAAYRRHATQDGNLASHVLLCDPCRIVSCVACRLLIQYINAGSNTEFVIAALRMISPVVQVACPAVVTPTIDTMFTSGHRIILKFPALATMYPHIANGVEVNKIATLNYVALLVARLTVLCGQPGTLPIRGEYLQDVERFVSLDIGDKYNLCCACPWMVYSPLKITWLFLGRVIPDSWSLMSIFTFKVAVVECMLVACSDFDSGIPGIVGHECRFDLAVGCLRNLEATLPVDCRSTLTYFSQRILKLYELSTHIYLIETFVDVERLSKQMMIRFCLPPESLLNQSPAVEFVHRYPGWFTQAVRLYAFRMRNTFFTTRFKAYCDTFGFRTYYEFTDDMVLRLHVRWNRIFDDGFYVLEKFTMHNMPVSIHAINGLGVPSGDTGQFLNQFADELRQRMFRAADDPNGLFPAADVSPEYMRMLGILLARVLYRGVTVDIRLNPEFFTLMRRGTFDKSMSPFQIEQLANATADARADVALRRVDPALETALTSGYTRGLRFVYPCRSEFPLEPGDEMRVVDTIESEQMYACLVRSYTCGGRFRQRARAPFIEGFDSVFRYPHCDAQHGIRGFEGLAALFTDDELPGVFAGNPVLFTPDNIDDLEVGFGYESDSPPIAMLKTVLLEMSLEQQRAFLMFTTSTKFLPLGGLKAIHPRLSIEKLEMPGAEPNCTYPSVIVCTHTLRIPPYSDVGTLRSMLIDALVSMRFL